jgi:hypothetical protein
MASAKFINLNILSVRRLFRNGAKMLCKIDGMVTNEAHLLSNLVSHAAPLCFKGHSDPSCQDHFVYS